MKLRLVHTLSILLVAVISVAVLSFGLLLAWNLRSGFNAYLSSRDQERLGQFAALLGADLERAGGVAALTDGRIDMHAVLDDFAVRQGYAGPGPQGPPPRGLLSPGPPPTPGAPPPGGFGFGERIGVYGLEGQLLAGPPDAPAVARGVAAPVVVHGSIVAHVALREAPPVPDAVESEFLRRQLLGIGVLAGALLLAGLVLARWLAGWWVRPLLGIEAATARLARGDFATRLETRRQDEIGDLIGNVNRMAEGLERLEGARRRWIAEISHELRTPLTVLRGEIDALADGVRTLDAAAVLSLRDEALRLGALVDDLHLLAMADLQALRCHFALCDARELIGRVCARFAVRAAAAGIALAVKADSPASLEVQWDAQRIDQLLSNLVDNSLRYTDAPGRIELGLRLTGEHVVLSVEDSAPGVPEGDLPRLFEPLYRADRARSRHRGGSGLGLAIAAALVATHRGEIKAGHAPLGGLAVWIKLPREAGEAV